MIKEMIVSLPSSSNLNTMWNLGSLLGMVLMIQIMSGFMMTLFYSADSSIAFYNINNIMSEVNWGWFFRVLHFNTASLFFICLFLHMFKGLYYHSFRLKEVWMSGLTMLILIMAESFLGYVLVWGQMSYWACVVITSLLSVIPMYGETIVTLVWGGFMVNNMTLKLFFSLHFLIPFILLLVMTMHLMMLHKTGSSSTLAEFDNVSKFTFYPNYWAKDSYNLVPILMFMIPMMLFPFYLGDPEMFIEANPMVSPVHIVPEWYFLFAYAILRAIPNKIIGVLALAMSIGIFYMLAMMSEYSTPLNKFHKYIVLTLLTSLILLTWLGQCSVELPYTKIALVMSMAYFNLVLLLFTNHKLTSLYK